MSVIESLSDFAKNLRWMMYRRDPNPSKWAMILSGVTRSSVDSGRAFELLGGARPTPAEIEVIAELSGQDPEELQSVPMYGSGEDIRRENLRYLLDALPTGASKEAAKTIGITPSQLSRWRNDVGKPHPSNLRRLLKFHGVDPDTDIGVEALFLSMDPISAYGKKQWVLERVQEMAATEISKIYPALKRMLRSYEND